MGLGDVERTGADRSGRAENGDANHLAECNE
jgi:hypothetical protein